MKGYVLAAVALLALAPARGRQMRSFSSPAAAVAQALAPVASARAQHPATMGPHRAAAAIRAAEGAPRGAGGGGSYVSSLFSQDVSIDTGGNTDTTGHVVISGDACNPA
jgi:hypothetical protein